MDVDNTPSSVCSQSQNSQDQGVDEGENQITLWLRINKPLVIEIVINLASY